MDESAAPAEMPPAKTGPRFPWVAAVLCAVSLGAAAWTWMRYSYAWDVTLTDIHDLAGKLYLNHLDTTDTQQRSGEYVRLQGLNVGSVYFEEDMQCLQVMAPEEPGVHIMVRIHDALEVKVKDCPVEATGRVMKCSGYEWWNGYPPVVDSTASRFHGASIFGLAVGAMGVFVFALYLRTWLRERRVAA